MRIDQLIADRGFLEAPIYDDDWGLLFADSTLGGVWRLLSTADGPAVKVVVPFRRGISGIALHETGAIIVGGRNVAAKVAGSQFPDGWCTTPLISEPPTAGSMGFADLTVDPQGRLLVGTLGFRPDLRHLPSDPPPGALACLHLDGTLEVLNDNVLLSNGLDTSPDGTRLYHVDSLRHAVLVYQLGSNGSYGEPNVFAHVPQGLPDGLTVSRDGHVLVALAYYGGVLVLDANGGAVDTFAVPAPMTTSLCYGGPNLTALYVVSGFIPGEVATEERGGGIFLIEGAGEGKPAIRARVTLTDPNVDISD